METLEPGAVFGRYRIERLLGTGGMGRVYAAHDTVLRRKVAIKLLFASSGDTLQAALREARAAAALSHPNAVAIFDVGEHGGTPFIAMEMLDGRPLRAYVGDATTSIERKTRWLADIARALAAAHDAGLIHRDIKPANVFVTNGDVVKVLDFGIAKRTSGDADLTAEDAETALGQVKGTPKYMAPEQLAGRTVDARVDQFAWGLVAYELLTGVHAWSTVRDGSEADLETIIETRDPKRPASVYPGIPAAFDRAILRALSKKPESRFPSMHELVHALDDTSAETSAEPDREPTAETRPAIPPKKTRGYGRAWLLAPVGLAAGVLVLWASRSKTSPPIEKDGRWSDTWRARMPPFYWPYVWTFGWAPRGDSREDADEAMRRLADLGGAPPAWVEYPLADAYLGRLFALTGKNADAIPMLRRAAHSCSAIESPIVALRARYDLAIALASSGDGDAACAELRQVLSRWGGARTSITARAAKTKWRELGCR